LRSKFLLIKRPSRVIFALCLCTMSAVVTGSALDRQQFTYAWPFAPMDSMKPRGGTTQGADVTLQRDPDQLWFYIQESGLEKIEKDRRAIRAMSGAYRASFDFLELVGFEENYQPKAPYQSWGTEYVYIVTDDPFFISLQHVLVMSFVNPDSNEVTSAVVKHWRQDWSYEDTVLNVFDNNNTWRRIQLPKTEAAGKWSQAVFQVDDSPRYESIGLWVHSSNYSSWESGETRRPLPRREFSVRDDYDLLVGVNRHTITPTGWVHEEDNLKVVVGESEIARNIARESGFNRYERIIDHDFSAGHEYWSRTKQFWADVRAAWDVRLRIHDEITFRETVDGKRLFQVMFSYAEGIPAEGRYDSEDGTSFINSTLDAFTRVSK
jgi:hypothetical protein